VDVSVSLEIRELAFEGHALYEAFFPQGSKLRGWLDALPPGHRIDISWTRRGHAFIPHVPWGLMYLPHVPLPGQPVDAMGFLGQRFRLSYTAHPAPSGDRALGGLDDSHRAHFLHWGDDTDPTGREARWQQKEWQRWTKQIFVPSSLDGPDLKTELLTMLAQPQPSPVAVLYLFCQCNIGTGADGLLRFGPTSQPAHIVRRTDLATTPLADHPLVFVNACSTAASDPYVANELELAFFKRGCRAYLGTETKVPIAFASRFAAIFFHFFYRTLDPAPMAAGEAVAQTRLFLWTHYRNIGGLFYTYVNQYELFMAEDAEVRSMRV
jgi:hypothetical protein